MAKKRKQSWGAFPVMASVPTGKVKIKNPDYLEPAALKAKLRREEADENARSEAAAAEKFMVPVRAGEEELNHALREQAARVKKFFSLPIQAMADIGGVEFAPNDLIGDYPIQEGPKDGKADAAAYRRCKENLASAGCTLSTDGWNRLGTYLAVLHYHRNINVASVDSWAIGLERLFTLGVFQDGEITGYVPATHEPVDTPAPEPDPQATLDKLLETTSAESYEGRKKLVDAVSALASSEFAPLADEWIRHLGSTHGIYPTESDMTKIVNFFQRNNLYWGDRRSFDKARRYMILVEKSWPISALSESERLGLEIENSDINNYDTRRELTHKIKQPRA
jgi:hypothetical protein